MDNLFSNFYIIIQILYYYVKIREKIFRYVFTCIDRSNCMIITKQLKHLLIYSNRLKSFLKF